MWRGYLTCAANKSANITSRQPTIPLPTAQEWTISQECLPVRELPQCQYIVIRRLSKQTYSKY